MPTSETYIESEISHVGATGEAVFNFDDGIGFIQVKDRSGSVHELKAVNIEIDRPIAAGDMVVVVDYEVKTRTFRVQKAPDELARV